MQISNAVRAFTRLAVLTASLVACSAHDPSGDRVDAATVDSEMTAVSASSLPQGDKNAFEAFITDHHNQPGSFDGKTVRDVINMQLAYENGQKMAQQARVDEENHRREIAKLMRAIVLHSTEGQSIDLAVRIVNTTGKTVRRVEMGLMATHNGKRIGMCEVALDRDIAPNGTIETTIPLHYSQFGEDATPMMNAAGKPKTYALDVKEIKYTDGTDAGYDD